MKSIIMSTLPKNPMQRPSNLGQFAASLVMFWFGLSVGLLTYSMVNLPVLSTAVIISCVWVLLGIMVLENRVNQAKLERKANYEAALATEAAEAELAAQYQQDTPQTSADIAAPVAIEAPSTPVKESAPKAKAKVAASLDIGQIRVRTGINYKLVNGGSTPTGAMPTSAMQKVSVPELPLSEAVVSPAKDSDESISLDISTVDPTVTTHEASGPLRKNIGGYHVKQA
jgi:hypothetical protein